MREEIEKKAQELIERFNYSIPTHLEVLNNTMKEPVLLDLTEAAKQCALICVDEIINSCYWNDHKIKNAVPETARLSDAYFATYWQQVKQAIIESK